MLYRPVLNSLLTSYSVVCLSASFLVDILIIALHHIYRLVFNGVKYHQIPTTEDPLLDVPMRKTYDEMRKIVENIKICFISASASNP